ncbi:hypothetical protein V1512DRAFT_244733 [Lipomyces arxii]|uniref:uncharacterized protein n=1 Tax=Lipomyces arxii TaxID=56418 RepID=UPI0034CE3545
MELRVGAESSRLAALNCGAIFTKPVPPETGDSLILSLPEVDVELLLLVVVDAVSVVLAIDDIAEPVDSVIEASVIDADVIDSVMDPVIDSVIDPIIDSVIVENDERLPTSDEAPLATDSVTEDINPDSVADALSAVEVSPPKKLVISDTIPPPPPLLWAATVLIKTKRTEISSLYNFSTTSMDRHGGDHWDINPGAVRPVMVSHRITWVSNVGLLNEGRGRLQEGGAAATVISWHLEQERFAGISGKFCV